MLTGGRGYNDVYNFYKNHFIGKMPDDTKIDRISRTVGIDHVVDELILKFTHDREIEFMIHGIAPTGKYVELVYVIVKRRYILILNSRWLNFIVYRMVTNSSSHII